MASPARGPIEWFLRMGISGVTTRFLRHYVSEIAKSRAGIGYSAENLPDLLITIGELEGWWEDRVDAEMLDALTSVWYEALRQSGIRYTSLDAAPYYVTAVRDRLVRGLVPSLPVDAFNKVRQVVLESAAIGRTPDDIALEIARRLGWDFDGDYWRGVKSEADRAIDAILEPLGRPGDPARVWARLNDADVIRWRKKRNEAISRLESLKTHWQVRAERIARTETTGMLNAAQYQALIMEGIVAKRWLSAPDERTRESHVEAHDQIVGIFDPFSVGESSLAFPGDPSGPPGEVINCRCTMVGVSAAEYIEYLEGPDGPGTDPGLDIPPPEAFLNYPEPQIVAMDPLIASLTAEALEAFHLNQPRAPKGSSNGGQWVKAGRSAADLGVSERFLRLMGQPGTPETVLEATANSNPLGGKMNCQMTSTVWELRQRGFDVGAALGEGGDAKEDWTTWWNFETTIGITPSRYDHAEIVKEANAANPYGSPLSDSEIIFSKLLKEDSELPNGSRGFMAFAWEGSTSGHIQGWVKDENGDVTFYDPQTGEIGITGEIDKNQIARIDRTDNATFGFGDSLDTPTVLHKSEVTGFLEIEKEVMRVKRAYQKREIELSMDMINIREKYKEELTPAEYADLDKRLDANLAESNELRRQKRSEIESLDYSYEKSAVTRRAEDRWWDALTASAKQPRAPKGSPIGGQWVKGPSLSSLRLAGLSEPGTLPIPEGTIRLFHYTDPDNVESIVQHGLLESRAHGDGGLGAGNEPSAGVWAATIPPGYSHTYFEFWVKPEEISKRANFPHEGQSLEDFQNSNSHVILSGDLPPEQFVAFHDWGSSTARYLLDNPMDMTELRDIIDTLPSDAKERRAVELLMEAGEFPDDFLTAGGSPTQPRAPKGSPNGGQWIKAGVVNTSANFEVPPAGGAAYAMTEDTFEGGEFLTLRDRDRFFPDLIIGRTYNMRYDSEEYVIAESIEDYTRGHVANEVNSTLRYGEVNPSSEALRVIAGLDAGFEMSQAGDDFYVHRNVSLDAFGPVPGLHSPETIETALKGLEGKVIRDKGYLSTSLSETAFLEQSRANGWPQGEVNMKIKVPEGTPALYMEEQTTWVGQHEVLLPRDIPLAIDRVKVNSDGTYDILAVVATPKDQAIKADNIYETLPQRGGVLTASGRGWENTPPLAQDQIFDVVGEFDLDLVASGGGRATQPRAPKGSPIGGQWIKSGGGVGGGEAEWVSKRYPKMDPEGPRQAAWASNPLKGQVNCQMTTTAWELRQRGYDVVAVLGSGGPDGSVGVSTWWQFQDQARGPVSAETWEKAKERVDRIPGSDMSTEVLTEHIKNWEGAPPGSRGFIGYDNRDRATAHIQGWARLKDGSVLFYEPQNPDAVRPEYARVEPSLSDISLYRSDNAYFGLGNSGQVPTVVGTDTIKKLTEAKAEVDRLGHHYRKNVWPLLPERDQIKQSYETSLDRDHRAYLKPQLDELNSYISEQQKIVQDAAKRVPKEAEKLLERPDPVEGGEWSDPYWNENVLTDLQAAGGKRQPRHPKGSSRGGQWMSTTGGSTASWVDDYLPRIEPETALDATYKTNPYKERMNCQMAVTAWELRLRGYDAIASKGIGGTKHTGWQAWWEPKGGNAGENVGATRVDNPDDVAAYIEGKFPPGSRGFVNFQWVVGGSHVQAWVRDDQGTVTFYEPQTGGTGISGVIAPMSAAGFMRTDNATFGSKEFSKFAITSPERVERAREARSKLLELEIREPEMSNLQRRRDRLFEELTMIERQIDAGDPEPVLRERLPTIKSDYDQIQVSLDSYQAEYLNTHKEWTELLTYSMEVEDWGVAARNERLNR